MNTRVRKTLQTMKNGPKRDKEKENEERKPEMQGTTKLMDTGKGHNSHRWQSRRDRKIALQQDVDKLKKKLSHEENVHRALERAFTRPLGALPRLPPYLPSHTLELLAEVAVLEEEVVRLEEQVVNFRQGLYQEAICISSSRKTLEGASDLCMAPDAKNTEQSKSCVNLPDSESSVITKPSMHCSSNADPNGSSYNRLGNGRPTPRKKNSYIFVSEDRRGKENQLGIHSTRNCKQSTAKKVSKLRVPITAEKNSDVQPECKVAGSRIAECCTQRIAYELSVDEPINANKLSEEILKCLIRIFSHASCSVAGYCKSSVDTYSRDPYHILDFGKRDIGPYKHFFIVEACSIPQNLSTESSVLFQRLDILVRKLSLVDLLGLTHQQKLAFWINVYNSCMMKAFLEQGIPAGPQMVVAMMPKATINVGGQLLSAMAIEHFLLRLPCHSKHASPKGMKSDEMRMRGLFGMECYEPLVTFALSCGSWSSPAVRVYTASQVEKELETAKSDYLQAALGVAMPNKLAIPKLLHWYLLDFAEDLEALMDWICLQLPSELKNDAVKCLDMGRSVAPHPIQVLPYEFTFRYILAP
ncbi:uncharacterized protein [Typha angustifolia]|uniref:uncharacterized protein isoform X1 n=2 Tax=Typha angustifolia TaxID=59011 RepID=UPI003C30BECD